MNAEIMTDRIETQRLVLFPYTGENLRLFNTDLAGFEKMYSVVYRGEELDYLLRDFLLKLEKEIADDPEHYLFFTEFLIVLKENSHVIGSIDYKYVPRGGITEVGYGLNPAYTGRGYMTEALCAFLKFGKNLGIRTVRADTLKDNIRSQNVLRHCGFSRMDTENDRIWWEIPLDACRGETSVRTFDIYGENYSGFTSHTRAASRAIVISGGNILLSCMEKVGVWMIPGGGAEGSESPEECCIRELAEETGLLAQPLKCILVLNEYYEDWKYTSYYYLCRQTGRTAVHLTEQEKAFGTVARWIPLEEALAVFSRHADYTNTDEERRGIYLREYTALKEYCRSMRKEGSGNENI